MYLRLSLLGINMFRLPLFLTLLSGNLGQNLFTTDSNGPDVDDICDRGRRGAPGPSGRPGPPGPPGELNFKTIGYVEQDANIVLRQILNTDEEITQQEMESVFMGQVIETTRSTARIIYFQLANVSLSNIPTSSFFGQYDNTTDNDEYIINRLECSVKCGKGVMEVQKVKCTNVDSIRALCTKSFFVSEQCDTRIPCPEEANYGPWSGWSKCTKDCFNSVEDIPYQTRSRICTPAYACTTGYIEKRPCSVHVCPPECPKYSIASLITSEDNELELEASFVLEKANVSFGTLVKQELELVQIKDPDPTYDIHHGTKVAVWNVDNLNNNNEWKTVRSLRPKAVYSTKIRIHTALQLESKKQANVYHRLSTIIQECTGQVVVCDLYTCRNKTQQIPVDQLCDGVQNCNDGSDEDENTCQGDSSIIQYVTAALAVYVICGVFVYFAADKFFRETKKKTNDHTMKQCQEEMVTLRSSLFNVETLEILLKDRSQSGVLYPEERSVLRQTYLEHHETGHAEYFIEHVHQCASTRTSELVLDAILGWEESEFHFNKFEAVNCLVQNIANLELRGWTFEMLDRGIVYTVKQFFVTLLEKADCRSNLVAKLVGFLRAIFKVGLFYLDVYKDIVTTVILLHISTYILYNRFESVAGINFYILAWYLFAIILTTQFAITLFHIWERHRLDIYCEGRSRSPFIRGLAMVFPVHFAAFEQAHLENLLKEKEKELTKFYDRLRSTVPVETQDDNFILEMRQEYPRIIGAAEDLTRRLCQVNELDNRVQLIETFVERIPQAIVQMSLYLASKEFKRIRILFKGVLETQIGCSLDIIFAVATGLTFYNAIKSIVKYKNEKRQPLTPKVSGLILQVLATSALLIPKVLVMSTALINVPFMYGLGAIAELLLIAMYQRVIFRSKAVHPFDNVAKVITTSFFIQPKDTIPAHTTLVKVYRFEKDAKAITTSVYKQPKDTKPAPTKKIWSNCTRLNYRSGLVHSILLYFLTILFIYLPAGFALRFYVFRPLMASSTSLLFGEMILISAAGAPLYTIMHSFYYRYCHNWSLWIKLNYT